MKIESSLSNYYLSQRRSVASSLPALEDTGGDQAQRRSPPTIAPASPSASLSSALWLSLATEETTGPSITEGKSPFGSTVADEFLEWSKMSLAEKIRAQLLEARGLTEESLEAMPADERAAIEDEIRKAIAESLGIKEQASETASDIAGSAAEA
ncbi:hypothetical protein [Sinorhizobium terangae]|uniref:Uncharacterized protein n=1 Tax=Sinorhizobium terangae TaxID=110322 RepID=A0A6N7LKS1_SINTE|nr:hypothetical protein [Sinorhizobium terangae]MBB4184964.1 hypothetical protein [Sinorhizobium terangae]MQX18357.1 hypothetical protein [Sinorhizobium terangae]WFU48425.1 hypothetical protein QA637_03100 [Sinorhizobium terangae]